MKKLKSKRGDSLVEALFAILLTVMAAAVLCQSVVSAAKINREAKDAYTVFSTDGKTKVSGASVTVSVTIPGQAEEEHTVSSRVYRTKGGYYYYDET